MTPNILGKSPVFMSLLVLQIFIVQEYLVFTYDLEVLHIDLFFCLFVLFFA